MKLGQYVVRIDDWLLDEVCQPVADKLPEHFSAFETGMSCQLGALLFSAVSIIATFIETGFKGIWETVFNIFVWGLCVSFFIGLGRFRGLVRADRPNPLRHMLFSVRVLSVTLIPYVIYQAMTSSVDSSISAWFDAFSNIVFTVGLYFISCQPRPPYKQSNEKTWYKTTVGQGAGFS
ncbi:MAG: hypothetical protein IIT71_01000 [Acetobacter sp.]|nr:hypothetical protein [Acetobacter sp.]